MTRKAMAVLWILALMTGLSACSDNNNPMTPFEPEVVNTADAFQFQITAANDVTVTRSYTWNNTTNAATIDHSSAMTGGSGTVVVLDADGTEVYRAAMVASGTGQTTPGTPGNWTVQVVFSSFDGTANFRVEKLTL